MLKTSVYKGLEIIEENNYYPFGLKHKGYNSVVSSNGNATAQKFKYNGKELNEELGLDWYDLGARNLDHALGRFMNIDPKSEQYNFQSPYAFANNNPILFIDVNGEGVENEYEVNTGTGAVTQVSNLGGDEINYYHYSGGGNENLDGKTRILNTETGDDQTMSSSEWISGYTHRDSNVDYKDITSEFLNGTGPEKSLITEADQQMNKDIVASSLFENASKEFQKKWNR